MYFGTCTNNSSCEVGQHEVVLLRAADAGGQDVFVFQPRLGAAPAALRQ
jgi:hypothetical protein